jgi:hypothetical protein
MYNRIQEIYLQLKQNLVKEWKKLPQRILLSLQLNPIIQGQTIEIQ